MDERSHTNGIYFRTSRHSLVLLILAILVCDVAMYLALKALWAAARWGWSLL